MLSAVLLAVLVQPGDTMSGIAASHNVSLAALEAANPQLANPDLIFAGQSVSLPGGGTTVTAAVSAGDGDHDSDGGPGATALAAAPAPAGAVTSPVHVSAPGSFQACVIARESGGNPHAVNPTSGAGGLYQFLPSVWTQLGFSGLPQNASVATQNAAFAKGFAMWGKQPWSSDGC